MATAASFVYSDWQWPAHQRANSASITGCALKAYRTLWSTLQQAEMVTHIQVVQHPSKASQLPAPLQRLRHGNALLKPSSVYIVQADVCRLHVPFTKRACYLPPLRATGLLAAPCNADPLRARPNAGPISFLPSLALDARPIAKSSLASTPVRRAAVPGATALPRRAAAPLARGALFCPRPAAITRGEPSLVPAPAALDPPSEPPSSMLARVFALSRRECARLADALCGCDAVLGNPAAAPAAADIDADAMSLLPAAPRRPARPVTAASLPRAAAAAALAAARRASRAVRSLSSSSTLTVNSASAFSRSASCFSKSRSLHTLWVFAFAPSQPFALHTGRGTCSSHAHPTSAHAQTAHCAVMHSVHVRTPCWQ